MKYMYIYAKELKKNTHTMIDPLIQGEKSDNQKREKKFEKLFL